MSRRHKIHSDLIVKDSDFMLDDIEFTSRLTLENLLFLFVSLLKSRLLLDKRVANYF